MNKIYFVSYYFSGVHPTHSIYTDGNWAKIQNDIVKDKHPLIWERDKNIEFDKGHDVGALTRIRIIWWKELSDEEIQELGL